MIRMEALNINGFEKKFQFQKVCNWNSAVYDLQHNGCVSSINNAEYILQGNEMAHVCRHAAFSMT